MTRERAARGRGGPHGLKVSWLWCLSAIKTGSPNQKHVLKIDNVWHVCQEKHLKLHYTCIARMSRNSLHHTVYDASYQSPADVPRWALTLRRSPWQPRLHSSHTVPFLLHAISPKTVFMCVLTGRLCGDRKLSHNQYSNYIQYSTEGWCASSFSSIWRNENP